MVVPPEPALDFLEQLVLLLAGLGEADLELLALLLEVVKLRQQVVAVAFLEAHLLQVEALDPLDLLAQLLLGLPLVCLQVEDYLDDRLLQQLGEIVADAVALSHLLLPLCLLVLLRRAFALSCLQP